MSDSDCPGGPNDHPSNSLKSHGLVSAEESFCTAEPGDVLVLEHSTDHQQAPNTIDPDSPALVPMAEASSTTNPIEAQSLPASLSTESTKSRRGRDQLVRNISNVTATEEIGGQLAVSSQQNEIRLS